MTTLLSALRAAAEITRLRILSILSSSELTVSELVQILGQSQPRVSRHLKLLCDSGLLQRYQEGSWVFHRIADSGDMAGVARGILEMIDTSEDEFAEDQVKLTQIKTSNAQRAAEYFSRNASEWDNIRNLAVPDTDVENKLLECLTAENPDMFLDLGTGTGRILELFSPRIRRGVGIDLNREMLMVARANLDAARATNCAARHGDIHQLTFDDESVDVVTIHQVLHYLERPDKAIREAARVLKTGGQLIIVDFLPHELEFLREDHAHRRLGFSNQVISNWGHRNNLQLLNSEKLEPMESGKPNMLNVGLWNLAKMN